MVVLAAAASFNLGLSRVLAEAFPLSLRFLASWPGTLALLLVLIPALWFLWRNLSCRCAGGQAGMTVAFLPLFLPFVYVVHGPVDLLQGATLLVGSVLLSVCLVVGQLAEPEQSARVTGGVLLVTTLAVYLATLGTTVGEADTFEFQVVAYRLGIAHPTGYPLYLLLGKLATLLPIGSIAWRVNSVSAVCAAGAVWLLYRTLLRLFRPHRAPAIALLVAWSFAFSPTFWSQAVEAEVYALNAFWVALVCWLLVRFLTDHSHNEVSRGLPWLGLALGLGLANHLTTVVLLAPVGVTLVLLWPRVKRRRWLLAGLGLLAGLAFYLYLPWRWPAVNDGQLMSLSQFFDWVLGGRFQGALQLGAWHSDPTRYEIVGRLALSAWGWPGLALAAVGLVWLFVRRWRVALVTLAGWLGYSFYALSYYVPDISVFYIPAWLLMAIWLGAGVMAGIEMIEVVARRPHTRPLLTALAILLLALLPLGLVSRYGPQVDRSAANPLDAWGRAVLAMELDPNAAILADSVKVAPLYYLQQTENLRPDLEIVVLPDEAAYRAQLDVRLAAGQTVYLARFLPGLEGVYYLSSVGPLLRVSATPQMEVPALDETLDLPFGPHVTLLGYRSTGRELRYPATEYMTLYWTCDGPVDGVYQVWLRLVDAAGQVQWSSSGVHPAGNYYPTSAWRPGEVIADAHALAVPATLTPGDYQVQVALRVPFGSAALLPGDQSDPWLAVGNVQVTEPEELPAAGQAVRIWAGEGVITSLDAAAMARPGAEFPVDLTLAGDLPSLRLAWGQEAVQQVGGDRSPVRVTLKTPLESGEQQLLLSADEPLRCGWLRPRHSACELATVSVRGAPLPAGAVNFGDRIGLLDLEIPDLTLQPGGELALELHWQPLAQMDEDYTRFVHVLDAADHIVGQIDSWPVQGTWPTSQWTPGEEVTDAVQLFIASDAAPGPYRLEVGWYLLDTMQRVPVLGNDGAPVDDRVLLEGLVVPD